MVGVYGTMLTYLEHAETRAGSKVHLECGEHGVGIACLSLQLIAKEERGG